MFTGLQRYFSNRQVEEVMMRVDGKFFSKEPIGNFYHSTVLTGFTLDLKELKEKV